MLQSISHGAAPCGALRFVSVATGAALLALLGGVAAPAPCLAQDGAASEPQATAGEEPPAAQAAPDRFPVYAYDVSGATQLTSAEIEVLLYPFLGPDRRIEDVMHARKALQDAYAKKGYEAVLVDVPVQPDETFSQGIVLIAVNEAPVGRVEVAAARHSTPDAIREALPSLAEGKPLDVVALQRDIAEANRFPDRVIEPRFRPGEAPGTIDVALDVTEVSPFHARVELNNDNSPNTRSLRNSGTLRYTNLWGYGHTLSVTGSLAPQDMNQSAVLSASYSAPLAGTPWSFLIYGYTSNSNVAALGGTNVLGDGMQIGLRATYRLPSETSFQQISFGPDFKRFNESIFFDGAALQPTRIRYLPLVAEYALSGGDEQAAYGLTFGATAGFRVVRKDACFERPFATIPDGVATCRLANGDTGVIADQFTGRGVDASERFVHFNLGLDYSAALPGNLQIALRFSGQLADSSLVTNEQFSVGGVASVRGYYLSEATGDDGFVSSAELRSPDWGGALGTFADEMRVFAFGDMGYARVRAPAAGQQDDFRLFGVGGGVRLRLFKLLSGEFLIGVPLLSGPASDKGEPRYSFSITGEF